MKTVLSYKNVLFCILLHVIFFSRKVYLFVKMLVLLTNHSKYIFKKNQFYKIMILYYNITYNICLHLKYNKHS